MPQKNQKKKEEMEWLDYAGTNWRTYLLQGIGTDSIVWWNDEQVKKYLEEHAPNTLIHCKYIPTVNRPSKKTFFSLDEEGNKKVESEEWELEGESKGKNFYAEFRPAWERNIITHEFPELLALDDDPEDLLDRGLAKKYPETFKYPRFSIVKKK